MAVVTRVYTQYLNKMMIDGGVWTSATVNCALFSALDVHPRRRRLRHFWYGSRQRQRLHYRRRRGRHPDTIDLDHDPAALQDHGRFGGGAAGTTTWTSTGAGFSALAAKLYIVAGLPIAHIAFGETLTASGGGTFVITWDATNGVFSLASS